MAKNIFLNTRKFLSNKLGVKTLLSSNNKTNSFSLQKTKSKKSGAFGPEKVRMDRSFSLVIAYLDGIFFV